MLILGLTGSIGMGKSAAASQFKARGVPVFDADAEVHRLYGNEAIPLIENAFPGTTDEDGVDRVKLSVVLNDDACAFEKLEDLIHPLVLKGQGEFLLAQAKAGAKLVVLEIPLLYETGGDEKVDLVVVVSARAEQQLERVLLRPGMTEVKFRVILARQIADDEKRRRADYVVDTSGSIDHTYAQVDMIIDALSDRDGQVFDDWWREH